MLTRIFFACVFLGLFCACSPLNCKWMDHKFRQYSENSLDLLDMMANNSTNSTEDEEQNTVAFPHHLYTQVSKAPAEGKLAFTVQILKEVCALFEEDDSSSSWQRSQSSTFSMLSTNRLMNFTPAATVLKPGSSSGRKLKTI
ncbi:hypothetical protein CRENBAI_006601 [Crenichthys baileyi]|uniref:Uncharacterized protein n=1 Tax=Crenichthys baileyi TaxID=28760 RepID=A0AAV9R0G7_9TELE